MANETSARVLPFARPLSETNPHGPVVGWDRRDCSAYWAAYEGQTPRGWTRDSHGRAVCPRCQRKGASRG